MKRLVKKSFISVLILLSLITALLGVTPVYAASFMEVVPLSLPAGWLSGHLYSVWGSGASDVYAVGYGDSGIATTPLLYHNNGGGWSGFGLSLPTGWSSGNLFGVWGSSASDVYAVGTGHNGSTFLPLLYHKDVGGWNAFSLPLPAGITSGYLYGVWGSSASDVYAVGYGINGSTIVPLMYHANGISWSDISPGIPVGWSSVNLRGMWGSDAGNVYAVGYGNNGASLLPLLYENNTGRWAASTFSLPAGWNSGYLYGVWSSGISDAYTVGFGSNGGQITPLLYRNTGSGWTESNPSIPTGWSSGYLYGIWGSGASDIYAVGSGNNGSALAPLLYHNNGSGWTEASPSLPVGWSFGYLHSVWGSGSSDVYAVGTANNGSTNLPLLYHSSQGMPDLLPPGDVTNFAATTGTSSVSINLSWTAPADDAGNDGSGAVSSYLVKYSTTLFTSWGQGILVTTGVPAPAAPGTTQTITVSGLNPETQYYFAIRAQDEQNNLSSNHVTVSATTPVSTNSIWYISGQGAYEFGEEGDIPVPADYNGDGVDEIAIFRASNSTWYVAGVGNFLFGTVGDVPVVADYNGDGVDEIAIFRPSNGNWYIVGVNIPIVFGQNGDVPVPADYNGDGRDEIAVFRPSNGNWYIAGESASIVFGRNGDVPVVADYTGDGKDDIAVFRPSSGNWYIVGVNTPIVFGTVSDIPVVADYIGDGRDDIALFRPSNGNWYIVGVNTPIIFGQNGDMPMPADYSGDGKADLAVFRP